MNIETQPPMATELRKAPRPSDFGSGLEQLKGYVEDMRAVQEAVSTLSGLVGENSAKSLARFGKELSEFEPTITVLGQVKAGKTALVNALAGWEDLLPSDVNPWTSVVTSLHLTPGTERSENRAHFRFMSEKEWDRLLNKGGRMGELASRAGAESELQKIAQQIENVREKARQRLGKKFELLIGEEHEYGYFDKNLLEKYICLGDDFTGDEIDPDMADQGRFADILRSADLYLNSTAVPCNLCLRDTPGVNDTFMMREQITVQAIRESRLCIVVLSACQALTSVDMGLIRLISNLKSRNVVIFVNRIDELANPGEQVPEIERLIRDTLKKHADLEGVDIVFGSAYWASVALCGEINRMPQTSANALYGWAELVLDAEHSETRPDKMVWELSGMPALFRALSSRIVSDLGRPFLKKVAEAGISVASSEEAARKIRVEGARTAKITPRQALGAFDALLERHMTAFGETLRSVVEEYQDRADRGHAQFVERASQSLISHLEQFGPREGWRYDPTGLRVLMRSNYRVFGQRVKAQAERHYDAALQDVAELYMGAFGDHVECLQLSPPTVSQLPAPVTLGQTIALDFNDGWWMSWWKRLRGYDAFATQFRQLINGETEDFMTQIKTTQTDLVCRQLMDGMQDFFETQRDMLSEIALSADKGQDVAQAMRAHGDSDHLDKIRRVQAVLQPFATSETVLI
ncbi:MAG: dynamin family protein [Pseudomonadota bacterium]